MMSKYANKRINYEFQSMIQVKLRLDSGEDWF